jgi:NADP-dependent 3-hydroxy acid dehydrogenase YdfG
MSSEVNSIVLITGATSGIGKATAKRLAKKGYKVIITGRRKDRLDELEDKFKTKYGASVHSLCFDVTDAKACDEAIQSLPDEWKQIDILINNAGGAKGLEPIQDGALSNWDYMIDANVKGVLYMTKLIAAGMIARERGHIINISSIAGHEVYAYGAVYCAVKHAVTALTKGMRLDLYKHGIKVSQVSPGLVEDTEFALNRFNGDEEKANIYTDVTPLNAKNIADTIYYIISQPKNVNIQEVIILSTQQASAVNVDRSGRKYDVQK